MKKTEWFRIALMAASVMIGGHSFGYHFWDPAHKTFTTDEFTVIRSGLLDAEGIRNDVKYITCTNATVVEAGAFRNCPWLERVVLPGITNSASLAADAFTGCPRLECVDLQGIGYQAYRVHQDCYPPNFPYGVGVPKADRSARWMMKRAYCSLLFKDAIRDILMVKENGK